MRMGAAAVEDVRTHLVHVLLLVDLVRVWEEARSGAQHMDCEVRGQLEVRTTKDVLASLESHQNHVRFGRMDWIGDELVVEEFVVVAAMGPVELDIGHGQREDMIGVLMAVVVGSMVVVANLVRTQRQERRMGWTLDHCSELRV